MNPRHDPTEKIYINAWNMIRGIGAQKLHMIARLCGSFKDAWHTDAALLSHIGFSQTVIDIIIASRPLIDPFAAWDTLVQHGITLITASDEMFPHTLTSIPHPPFCLYVRGDLHALSLPSVAIVGSRKLSEYGLRATTILTREIAQRGIGIVSGLALGTDAAAHRATVDCDGTTIAVLAGGIDDASIAPRTNINLAHAIIARGGAIISEYPIGTTPQKGTFPARNRLMAALSSATIIIEASKDSGTLITAQHAITFKKPLFALPGSIFADNAAGPHQLILDKLATPIISAQQITQLFDHTQDIDQKKKVAVIFDDPIHQDIYNTINAHADGMQIDQLIKKTGHDAIAVSSALTMLEIDGHIKNIGNQKFVTI